MYNYLAFTTKHYTTTRKKAFDPLDCLSLSLRDGELVDKLFVIIIISSSTTAATATIIWLDFYLKSKERKGKRTELLYLLANRVK